MFELIPKELKDLPQWVCAKNGSKLPMVANDNKCASVSNSATWCDFETACASVESGKYDYLGFVFADNNIVGIDIDLGFDENGLLTDLAIDCMEHLASYTEVSKSGRGVHILVKGDIPFKGKNNGQGLEIYKVGRYFITTGKKLIYDQLQANQEGINYIVEKYLPEMRDAKEGVRGVRAYAPQYDMSKKDGIIHFAVTYPPIGSGGRNNSLTSLAGQLRTIGYDQRECYLELCRANRQACKPCLPDRELQMIVQSIYRYAR